MKNITKLSVKLLESCMKRSEETGDDVHFDFCPHVNAVYVRGFDGGWSPHKEADIRCTFYTQREKALTESYIRTLTRRLMEYHTPLSQIQIEIGAEL